MGETSPVSTIEAIKKAMRDHIKVDATGLSPAVASAYVFGFDEAAKAVAEIVARSTLVDVPVEPVAWLDDGTCRAGSDQTAFRVVTDEQKRGMLSAIATSFTTPLYTRPPHREGQDSAEVIPAGLVERCAEILEWKRTGKLPGNGLREMGQSIADRLGGSLFIDNGLNQAELATVDEALKLILALAATRSGSATGLKGCAE